MRSWLAANGQHLEIAMKAMRIGMLTVLVALNLFPQPQSHLEALLTGYYEPLNRLSTLDEGGLQFFL